MKQIVFPCQLIVDFDELGEVTLFVNYGVTSEDVRESRSMPLILPSIQEQAIKDFAKSIVLPQIKEHEGIA